MVPEAVTVGATVFAATSAVTLSVKLEIWMKHPYPESRLLPGRLEGSPPMHSVPTFRVTSPCIRPSVAAWTFRLVKELLAELMAPTEARVVSPRLPLPPPRCRTVDMVPFCWATLLPQGWESVSCVPVRGQG